MRRTFVKLGLLWWACSALVWARPATIFDYSAQLKLQESQSQNLRSLLADLSQKSSRLQSSLIKEEATFRRLVSQQAELGEIRKSLNAIRDLRVSLRMLDITCQRKLEAVLTAEQLEQWRAIQEQLKRQKKP